MLKAAIPDDAAVGSFILEANDIAAKSGVSLMSIAPRPVDTKKGSATAGLVAVPVSMAAQGSYPQILDFLGRLQHLPRLVVVDGMSAHAGGDGSRITMTLTARMFATKAAS